MTEQGTAQPRGSKCTGEQRGMMFSEAGAAKCKCSAALSWEASREDVFPCFPFLWIFQQVKLDLVVKDSKY